MTSGPAVVAQQLRHSTHDSLEAQAGLGVPDRNEAWADVKSPGDGRTYKVGTVRVRVVEPEGSLTPTLFSGSPALPSRGTGGINLTVPGVSRQVVILQVTDADQNILSQRFFYGTNTTAALPVNARGISVWPVRTADGALDLRNTRIAICGDSRDDALPFSQAPMGNTQNPFKGYIAVYDGSLRLLWTHHFFGTRDGGHVAITDVSIRIEGDQDVVTYCGVSVHGLAAQDRTPRSKPYGRSWLPDRRAVRRRRTAPRTTASATGTASSAV